MKGVSSFAKKKLADDVECIQISKLLGEVDIFLGESIRRSNTTFSITGNKDSLIYCYPTLTVQVIMNLVKNALDACKKEEKRRSSLLSKNHLVSIFSLLPIMDQVFKREWRGDL